MIKATLVAFTFAAVVLGQAQPYAQCGGTGYTGATTCTAGWTCTYSNAYYSQCVPSSASTTSKPTTTTSKPTTTSTSAPSGLTGLAATAPTKTPSTATGKLPALGWNSWNAYGCNVSAAKVLAAAQQFGSLGLQAAGYQYVNIDDCWAEADRSSSTGQIVPDPTKFPNGISGLATSVHALGLKIGIYSDAGTNTCAGYPGSLGNEIIDANTFASWGIDYLKYDNCNVPSNWTDAATPQQDNWYNSNSAIRYRQMTAALDGTNRPVQFELCIWGDANVWEWGSRVGHSWRIGGDASATWTYITGVIANNVNILSSINFYSHNDMDMMEIGNGDLTIEEQRTHFAAWTFLKSPILLGTDLSLLNSTQLAIIKNSELLAFHQDPNFGGPAAPFTPYSGAPTTSPPEYYSGVSTTGTHVFIINTSGSTATKQFKFSNVPGLGTSGTFKLHDMWAEADLSGTYAASATFSVSVAPHDTVAYLISSA